MPNKKITAMPSLAGNQVPTDLVTAVDLSAAPVNQNVKSTLNDLFAVITKNITDRAIRFQAPGSAPAVAAASQGALYHDGTAFLASSNGGAYEPLYTLSAQSAALVFAGPTSGPAATPTFRALALTDLPQIATASLLGRSSAGTGTPEQITSTAALLTWLQNPISANLSAAVTDSTGAGGALVFGFGPVLNGPRFDTIGAGTAGFGNNLVFSPSSGAVNFLEILNAVSGTGPTLRAAGSQTNVPLNLASKGNGIISAVGNQFRITGNVAGAAGILELRGGSASLSGGQIRLYEVTTNGTNYIGFQAPDSLANNLLFELPATDGTAGQAITTDGFGILTWASFNDAGFKNFLINGDFQISQRSTSVAAIVSSNYYTADRWHTQLVIAPGPNGQFTQSIESSAGNYPDNSGFRNSLKMVCSQAFSAPLGATAECKIEQRLEGQNLLPVNFGQTGAEPLTLSFWVRSNQTGVFIAELVQPAGSVQVSAAYTINTIDTWEKKSVTFPARTTGTQTANDDSYQLGVGFWLVAGSNYTSGSLQTNWGNTQSDRAVGQTQLIAVNDYLQITGVQLEIGTVATDFENLQFSTSLELCQRYYYQIVPGASNRGFSYLGYVFSTTQVASLGLQTPVTMRTRPAIITTGNGGDYFLAEYTPSGTFATLLLTSPPSIAGPATKDCIQLNAASAGLTIGSVGNLRATNSQAFLGFDAEL